jgi:hypothetical protein
VRRTKITKSTDVYPIPNSAEVANQQYNTGGTCIASSIVITNPALPAVGFAKPGWSPESW